MAEELALESTKALVRQALGVSEESRDRPTKGVGQAREVCWETSGKSVVSSLFF